MAAVDLEGYQRAWRLRHGSADDELMRQVFGQELDELQKKSPQLLDVARSYFPHLTSSTYEALAREPDSLRMDKDAKRAVEHSSQLARDGRTPGARPGEIEPGIKQQAWAHGELPCGMLTQHGALLELLELPQLLDACVRNQMYEESLELLAFCKSLLQAHEARGEDIHVLTHIKDQVAVQRTNLRDSLAAQLKTESLQQLKGQSIATSGTAATSLPSLLLPQLQA
eukprot:s2518_g2.t1